MEDTPDYHQVCIEFERAQSEDDPMTMLRLYLLYPVIMPLLKELTISRWKGLFKDAVFCLFQDTKVYSDYIECKDESKKSIIYDFIRAIEKHKKTPSNYFNDDGSLKWDGQSKN
jgi:hypothetical protein